MLWRLRSFPDFCEPCLPSPVERPPAGRDWIHEIKHDPHDDEMGRSHSKQNEAAKWGGPGSAVGVRMGLVHRFDDVPPYRLDCLVTLRRKVSPSLRFIECRCLLNAIPLRKAHTVGRCCSLKRNYLSASGA